MDRLIKLDLSRLVKQDEFMTPEREAYCKSTGRMLIPAGCKFKGETDRIMIPKEIWAEIGIRPLDNAEFLLGDDGTLILRRTDEDDNRKGGYLDGRRPLGL